MTTDGGPVPWGGCMSRDTWQRSGILATVAVLAFLLALFTLVSSFQWFHKPFPGFFLHGNLTVSPYFLPPWSGSNAGLKVLDQVVAVQGQPLARPAELYDMVRKYPAGSEFQYTVSREGNRFSVTIPSMEFSLSDWFLSFGVFLLTGIGFLVVGATPFYFRSPAPAASALFFMVSMVFVWFLTTIDFVTSAILPKELRIFAFTLTPSAGIHLGLLLATSRLARKGVFVCLVLIYGVSVLLGLSYSLTFHGPLEYWYWSLRASYGYSCVAALIFLGLLWFALRGSHSDLERSRLRVISVGAVLGFFLPTLGAVLTTSLFWEIPYNLALLPTVFFPLSVAYALLKYSLFDLGVVLKLSLSRAALTGFLLLIYILVALTLSAFVGIYEQDLLAPFLFSVMIVLVFNPLLRWIERGVDRYVYHKEYDPNELQCEVSVLLRTLSKTQHLADKFLKLVAEQVGMEAACLCFKPRGQDEYLEASFQESHAGTRSTATALKNLWIEQLNAHTRGISKDEIANDPVFQDRRAEFLRIFADLKSELLVPMILEEEILGFVSFGRKKSGREYSADDYRLLGLLTDQLVLSLENGWLFEESEKAKESYRRLYVQSEAMNRQLIEIDRLKKQFVANISHELRTPISTILGYSEVLLEPGFGGSTRVVLERIVNNGQDLSRLMDNLLDFSKLETGTLSTTYERVNIREVLESLEVMSRRLIREKPINFRIGVESAIEYIESDPKKLQQILMQLLTNALKFTDRGEIAVEIRSHSDGVGSFLEISVSDTGIGINPKDQEAIFEDFRQLDGSSTRHFGGTGLGLSLCKKLAQSLGGRIHVVSEVGLGSVFSLILPLQSSPRQAVSAL